MLTCKYLFVVAAFVGFVRCWDVAVTTSHNVYYYHNNGTLASTVAYADGDISAIVYDAPTDLLLLVDDTHPNNTIFRVTAGGYEPLVRKQNGTVGVAFDPVTGYLFWIADGEIGGTKGIYRMPLADAGSDGRGTPVLKRAGHFTAIAVDSCEGYIYWAETISTEYSIAHSIIKRSRFDGQEEMNVIEKGLHYLSALAVDHGARRLFWLDDEEGIHYKIGSSDLNGGDQKTLEKSINRVPKDIAVRDQDILWNDVQIDHVQQTQKNKVDAEPLKPFVYHIGEKLSGLAVNYNWTTKLEYVPQCANARAALSVSRTSEGSSDVVASHLTPKSKETSDTKSKTKPLIAKLTTNEKVTNEPVKDEPFTNETSKKSITSDTKSQTEPTIANETAAPSVPVINEPVTIKQVTIAPFKDEPVTNETPQKSITEPQRTINITPDNRKDFTPNKNTTAETTSTTTYQIPTGRSEREFLVEEGLAVCGAEGLDIRDPVIAALSVICGLLSIACAVLITKILYLKKRPRIKKRIIVNKNVTPLTARPEQQCEITIENCCNMNICETPCFEPRSTIRPSLIGAKAGKEEKKNLIANMEHPDDLY